jgi:hypothetical protein
MQKQRKSAFRRWERGQVQEGGMHWRSQDLELLLGSANMTGPGKEG